MTRSKGPIDPAFASLVRNDAFGQTTPEERVDLRSPERLERFRVELERTIQSISAQLGSHYDGTIVRDEIWRDGALLVLRKYRARFEEIKLLCAQLRQRWNALDAPALATEVARLRCAIREHAGSGTRNGNDPADYDLELWANVEGSDG